MLHIAYGENEFIAAHIHLGGARSFQLFYKEDVIHPFNALVARAGLHENAQLFHIRKFGAVKVFKSEHALSARHGSRFSGQHHIGIFVRGYIRRHAVHIEVSARNGLHSRVHFTRDVGSAAVEYKLRALCARYSAFDIGVDRVHGERAVKGERTRRAEYRGVHDALSYHCVRIQLNAAVFRRDLQRRYGQSALFVERISRHSAYLHVARNFERAVYGERMLVEIYDRGSGYFQITFHGDVLLQIHFFITQLLPIHGKQIFRGRHGVVVCEEYSHRHYDRRQNRHRKYTGYHADDYLFLAGHRFFYFAAAALFALFFAL